MIKYQYSIMLASGYATIQLKDGIINTSSDGQIQVLTTEDEANRLSRQLVEGGTRFSMSRVSLDDVFFHLVKKSSDGAESP